MPTRVVILGGGFGGIYSLFSIRHHLKHIPHTVTIISDSEFFSFTPFLSEVAANILHGDESVTPVLSLIQKSHEAFIKEEVSRIDFNKKEVMTTAGQIIPYDYLVIAIGSKTNFMHIPGAKQNSLVLKDVKDAEEISEAVTSAFEKACNTDNPEEKKKLLTFAIIGGGPTGVELAGNLADHAEKLVNDVYPSIPLSDICIEILTGGTEIIKELPESLQEAAKQLIAKEHVTLRLNARVTSVENGVIKLQDKSEIKAHLIVWAAGVIANDLILLPDTVIDQKSHKFIVNDSLQLSNFPEVFAIGDVAMFADPVKQLPMLAQAAVLEGRLTGKNIRNLIEKTSVIPFKMKLKGEMVSLGRGIGVGSIYGIKVKGSIAWFLWKVVYLYKYIEFKKKPTILYHWLLDLFD